MRLNWLGYTYTDYQGYGKYNSRMVAALRKLGVDVLPELVGAATHADWLLRERGMHWQCPTISCVPPYHLVKTPEGSGPHWLLTMTEGGKLPEGWLEAIEKSGVERLIVPCQHNADAFARGGVTIPISVIPGGIDPDELPMVKAPIERPYTFLALADRGDRKGWVEVYAAFYKAFGAVKDTGLDKVRLIIKCRPNGNSMIELISKAQNLDSRITFMMCDMDMNEFYEMGDCFAIPSRSEGWGLPHRECAAKGIPVITQAHSGLDDGHTREWALVLENGQMRQIDDEGNIAGDWMVADTDELAYMMRAVYDEPYAYRKRATYARQWLKANQTWGHAAAKLLQLMAEEGLLPADRPTVEMDAIRSANAWYFDQHEMSYQWQH